MNRFLSRYRLAAMTAICLTGCLSALGLGASEREVDADSPYMQLVERADSLCSVQSWAEAAITLQHAIASEPSNPGNIPLLSNLGMVHHYMGEDSLAIATLTKAHEQAPSSVTILSNRAKVYTAMGREQDAFDDYARVMDIDSTYITARFNHGLLALRHRMFAVAQEDFDYLESHFPAADETFIARATFLSSLGRYAEAIPYYDEILRTIKAPEYYGARAYCRLMTGDLPEAADDISQAMELAPDDGELYLYRAALNKMHYRPDDARRDARRAIELGVEPARAAEFLK